MCVIKSKGKGEGKNSFNWSTHLEKVEKNERKSFLWENHFGFLLRKNLRYSAVYTLPGRF